MVKTYLKVSAINLLFLVAGALIWPAIVNSYGVFRSVHAQEKDKPQGQTQSTAPVPPLDANVDYVSPAVSFGGPAVTNTFLASRIACDRLEVNGFEPLRLSDAIISLLVKKGIANNADVQEIVQAGKAPRPLRIKPSPQR